MGGGGAAVTANEAAKWRTSVCVTPLDISKDIWGYFHRFLCGEKPAYFSPEVGQSPSVIVATKRCIKSQTKCSMCLNLNRAEIQRCDKREIILQHKQLLSAAFRNILFIYSGDLVEFGPRLVKSVQWFQAFEC